MLTYFSQFAGVGGDTEGAAQVPGVEPVLAMNHFQRAVESHSANFPWVDHILDDVTTIDITGLPHADLYWASPACPYWTDARGKRRDFDKSTLTLFDQNAPDEKAIRSRALMEEVPRYLRAMSDKGRPVLAGVVENVIQCRKWDEWNRWLSEIRRLGYHIRVIAFNSMHATPRRSPRAPQSRDRLYVAYWHHSLGRNPDWDKWLRPRAWCDLCATEVDALQVFKKPGVDMGCYGARNQYLYRCPKIGCRGNIVEPATRPAAAIIDWTVPGPRLAEREDPLVANTLDRIRAGRDRYVTREVAAPPALFEIPEHGPGRPSAFVDAHPQAAGGAHTPDRSRLDLLVPYYSTGVARPIFRPSGTLSTRDRFAWASCNPADTDLDDVRYRMLLSHEVGAGMAFRPDYIVLGTHAEKVRQYGNAVTPPVAEILICALVEAITGSTIPRGELALTA
ncbi:DNA cytosine methyltransferase [Embleya sp. NBC_00896]|uniref:DNA cytosine methyltransferase n=1 Tax=Embleya sp. NBC_00896 TaxID=2975961 RepID=UPI002F9180D8|nr:DNA cytosine methyltransferase [Embleya sp. NBC_00896]